MANIKPLVLKSGEIQQLQVGDILVDGAGAAIGGGGTPATPAPDAFINPPFL